MSVKRVEIPLRGNAQDRAVLARLIKELPLQSVLNITATMLAERNDLDGRAMQRFQRQVADMTWPLVTVDDEDVHNY